MKLKALFALLGFIGSIVGFGTSIWNHNINGFALSSSILFALIFIEYMVEE